MHRKATSSLPSVSNLWTSCTTVCVSCQCRYRG